MFYLPSQASFDILYKNTHSVLATTCLINLASNEIVDLEEIGVGLVQTTREFLRYVDELCFGGEVELFGEYVDLFGGVLFKELDLTEARVNGEANGDVG